MPEFKQVSVRVTKEDHRKLKALGGPAFILSDYIRIKSSSGALKQELAGIKKEISERTKRVPLLEESIRVAEEEEKAMQERITESKRQKVMIKRSEEEDLHDPGMAGRAAGRPANHLSWLGSRKISVEEWDRRYKTQYMILWLIGELPKAYEEVAATFHGFKEPEEFLAWISKNDVDPLIKDYKKMIYDIKYRGLMNEHLYSYLKAWLNIDTNEGVDKWMMV